MREREKKINFYDKTPSTTEVQLVFVRRWEKQGETVRQKKRERYPCSYTHLTTSIDLDRFIVDRENEWFCHAFTLVFLSLSFTSEEMMRKNGVKCFHSCAHPYRQSSFSPRESIFSDRLTTKNNVFQWKRNVNGLNLNIERNSRLNKM